MITRREIPVWLPLALLGLVLAALFYRLLDGQTLFWGLPTLQFYPWRQFAFAELRAGHLPGWNPTLGAGAPLLANYQTAVFYPPNWLFLVLPGPQAMSWGAVLHVVWAGLGMWLFAGALGLTPFGRGMSTLSYALSGYLIARLGSFPTAGAVVWMPWVIWLVHRTITRQDVSAAGFLALAFGMQLLVGHAQTTWYSTYGAGLYALWLALWQIRNLPLRSRISALLLTGAAMLLGVAVAAIQLVPTAEYLQQSQRSGGLDYDTLTNFSYHPMRLLTLLSPDFFGTPADGSYLTKGIYYEDAAYIGFIPFVSALAAVIGWFRKRKSLADHPAFRSVPFWSMLALAAGVIATGRHGPVFRVLYDYVPTFDAFRDPVRWLILVVFSLSVLAGIGVHHWGRGKWVVFWSRLAAAGGGAMIVLTVVALEVVEFDSENLRVLSWGMAVLGCWIVGAALLTLTQPVEASPVSPFLWQVAVLVFVALDLGWMANGLNPTVPTEIYDVTEPPSLPGRVYWFDDYEYWVTFGTDEDDEVQIDGYFDVADYPQAVERWRAMRASLLPNINMLDRVLSLNNNDPLLPAGHAEYINLIEDLGTDAGPLLRAAGVTHTFGKTPQGWQGENPAVVPDADAVTLAWLVPRAVWADEDAAIEVALRDPTWNPLRIVILAGSPDVEPEYPAAVTGRVVVLQDDAATRRYHVTTDVPAFLVISQTWYPGWSARLDGNAATIYRANLAFQAVAVPVGDSEVTLEYRINHWREGVAITLAALLVTSGLIIVPSVWRRRGSDAN